MIRLFRRQGAAAAAGALALLALAATAPAHEGHDHHASQAPSLPLLVYVERLPLPGGRVPGLGPQARTAAPGGRLMLRGANGVVRPLFAAGTMWDCADPAPSPDGRRIAFAGVAAPGAAWRVFVVGADGRGLAVVTRDARGFTLHGDDARAAATPPDTARFDDLAPCWAGAHLLCFASTRFPLFDEYSGLPVTNLWLVNDDGTGLRRLTAERNGADQPAVDPRTGAIVYARWWHSRWLASARDPRGLTEDPSLALPRDSVNAWQLVRIVPGAHGPRLAAGDVRTRLTASGTEPAFAAGGALLATYALNLGLAPGPGATGIHRLDPRGAATREVAGAIVPRSAADPYRAALGLAPPSACSPAVLPDGRVVMSYDPGARGDYGLWLVAPGSAAGSALAAEEARPEPLVRTPGRMLLGAAPLVARPAPHAGWERDRGIPNEAEAALARGMNADAAAGTFTFEDRDVFASGGLPGAPPREPGVTLRVFAALPRPERAGGDTVVLVRTAPVDAHGAVRLAGLPAATPLFEQLVRRDGTPLMSAHGPAQVPGFNAGSAGAVTRCVGCHTGHSRLPVPLENPGAAK